MACLKKDGFEFVVHSGDHPPPHVHIYKDDTLLKVKLSNLMPIKNYGMSVMNRRRAFRILMENQRDLQKCWKRINGKPKDKKK